jgi:hypothetical protein
MALLLAAIALAAGQEPTVIRMSDAVGDTIDRAERDSFHLFPNTAGFQHAAIVELPKPEILADVTLAEGDSARRVFLRLMPSQLERIRFLVDNRDFVAAQLRADSSAARTLASFWQAIEEHPLRSMAGEPADARDIAQPIPRENAASESSPSANSENRYLYSLHGATLGSIAGGCIGSHAGITYTRTEEASCLFPAYDVYTLDPSIFWGASCGITALGTGVGYALGAKYDRDQATSMAQLKEGTSWRAGMAVGGLIAGAALGFGTFIMTASTRYGVLQDFFDEIENDENDWTVVPMAFTGLCITVEGATIGYRIGRAIDRREAEEAEARRRALGR